MMNLRVIGGLFVMLMLVGAGCGSVAENTTTSDKATLEMPSGKTITVDVARTLSEQATGLSGRDDVSPGMLFCMGDTKVQNFWMLGMKVPIDVVWIHGGDVDSVSVNVPLREDDDVARMSSIGPVNMVLELPAGDAERFDIQPGDVIAGVVEACG